MFGKRSYVARILTVVRTCKKQGRRAFDFLAELFTSAIRARPPPLLFLESS